MTLLHLNAGQGFDIPTEVLVNFFADGGASVANCIEVVLG